MLADIFKNAVENARKPEDLRIFCDVDGTLLNPRLGVMFNLELLHWLYDRLHEGYEVTIFSASDSDRVIKDMCSIAFDRPRIFENDGVIVLPKSRVKAGTKALLVIDDNHASHSVDAKHRWKPDDPDVLKYIQESLKRPIRPMPPGML